MFHCADLSEKVVGIRLLMKFGSSVSNHFFLITHSPWVFVKLKRLEVLV